MKAKIGKSYLTEIPHERGKLTFQYPAFRGTYGKVAEQLDTEKIKRPNSPETASLIYDAFQNPKGEYESKIIKILNNAWFWEFTGNDYLPKGKGDFQNGVFLWDNPLIVDNKIVVDKNDLIRKMSNAKEFKIKGHSIFVSPDRSVRFTPFGFETGGHPSIRDFIENPYNVARYLGREGNELENSEKLGFVASKYKKNPCVFSFDSVNEEKVRMSTLASYWDNGYGLLVGGYSDWGDDGYGNAFGVCDSEKKK